MINWNPRTRGIAVQRYGHNGSSSVTHRWRPSGDTHVKVPSPASTSNCLPSCSSSQNAQGPTRGPRTESMISRSTTTVTSFPLPSVARAVRESSVGVNLFSGNVRHGWCVAIFLTLDMEISSECGSNTSCIHSKYRGQLDLVHRKGPAWN